MRVVGSFETGNYEPIFIRYSRGVNNYAHTLTGSYFPFCSGTVDGVIFSSAVEKMSQSIQVLASPNIFQFGYLYQENKFFISCSVGNLSFSNEASRLFGFPASIISVSYVTSSNSPYFIWNSNEYCYTKYSNFFEDETPQRQVVADDGRVFGISNDDNFKSDMVKFTFTNEPKWKIFNHSSASNEPYTWEGHVLSHRSYHPWIVFGNLSSSIIPYESRIFTLKFSGRFANFKPKKYFVSSYTVWDADIYANVLSTGSNSEPSTPQPVSFDLAYFVFDPANTTDNFVDDSYNINWTNNGYGFASASIINGNPFYVNTDSVGKYVSVASSSAQFSTRLAVSGSDWTIVCVANCEDNAGQFLTDIQSPRFIPILKATRWGSFDSGYKYWGTNTINEPVSWIVTAQSSSLEYNGYNTGSLSVFSPQAYAPREILSGDGTARLFSTVTATGPWIGKIYFYALYPFVFTAEQRTQMDEYLAYRFPLVYM